MVSPQPEVGPSFPNHIRRSVRLRSSNRDADAGSSILVRKVALGALLALAACGGETPVEEVFLPQIITGEPVRVIGSPGDSSVLTFGIISDVDVRPDGTLLITDRLAARIVHVSPEGTVITTFGRSGSGPGEFVGPLELALLPGDEYAVLDGDRGLATRVKVDAGRHSYVADVPIRLNALHICSLGAQLVIDAHSVDHGFYRYDLEGEIVQGYYPLPETVDPAFGAAEQDDLRNRLGLGNLRCLETGQVLFLPEYDSTLRAFALNGHEAWSVQIQPHSTLGYRRDASGRMAADVPPQGWVHRGVSVHALGPDLILVQLQHYGESAGGYVDPPVEVRLIRPSTGEQRTVIDTLPILAHLDGEFAWGWRNLPFPQVVRMPFKVVVPRD